MARHVDSVILGLSSEKSTGKGNVVSVFALNRHLIGIKLPQNVIHMTMVYGIHSHVDGI
jgi:hypothetical protein